MLISKLLNVEQKTYLNDVVLLFIHKIKTANSQLNNVLN